MLLMVGNLASLTNISRMTPDCVISDFPEYATNAEMLAPDQTRHISELAAAVVRSLSTTCPVRKVVVVGHADLALRKEVWQRAAFEQKVSQNRSLSAARLFMKALALKAGNASVRYMVQCERLAVGSTQRVVLAAHTEADMRKNRRVEFFLVGQQVHRGRCNCV